MKLKAAHLMCDGKEVLAPRRRSTGLHKPLVTQPIGGGSMRIVPANFVASLVRKHYLFGGVW